MASDLRKREAGYTAGTREVDQGSMKPWARRKPGPGARTDSGQAAAGIGGAAHRLLLGLRGAAKAVCAQVGTALAVRALTMTGMPLQSQLSRPQPARYSPGPREVDRGFT